MVICLNTSTGLTQKKCRMEGTQRRRRVYGDRFGTFATSGSDSNSGNGNERVNLKGLKLGEDTFFSPIQKLPIAKDREYLIAHPQKHFTK